MFFYYFIFILLYKEYVLMKLIQRKREKKDKSMKTLYISSLGFELHVCVAITAAPSVR